MALDLSADAAALTAALVDIESVSGAERRLAGEIAAALRRIPHLTVSGPGSLSGPALVVWSGAHRPVVPPVPHRRSGRAGADAPARPDRVQVAAAYFAGPGASFTDEVCCWPFGDTQ